MRISLMGNPVFQYINIPTLKGIFKAAGSTVLASVTIVSTLSVEPAHVLAQTSQKASCDGKLGVHRTVKVSNRNTILVGVNNHGRIGLKPRELVLTFDDGPRPGSTERILEALAEECVKATFFSLGRAAREAPHLLRRAAREGHTIATHSQSHPLLTKRDNNSVRNEIRRGVNSVNAALEGSGHKASNFFCYPFLDRSKRTDAIVREMDLVAFHMNIDSWDWRKQTANEMVALTMRRVRAEGSGIVLFHDIQDKTAAGLPEFLQTIKREGYKIVHVVPGESNFDYRQELANRKVAAKRKTVKTAKAPPSNLEQRAADRAAKLKARKLATRKLRKAPHPKRKPISERLALVSSSSQTGLPVEQTQDAPPTVLSPNNNQIAGLIEEAERAGAEEPKKKRKRFRLFRKIFRRSSEQ